jgi:hypothetical protein
MTKAEPSSDVIEKKLQQIVLSGKKLGKRYRYPEHERLQAVIDFYN